MTSLVPAATALFALLPRSFRLALGRGLGRLAWALHIRRRIALGNLALAFPDWTPARRRRIAREAYANAGAGLADFVGAGALPPDALDRLFVLDGFDRFERLFAEGRGVVVASAHLGPWELLAAACARRGIPLNIVTRSLRGAANRQLVAARAKSGVREIPARGALAAGVQALRRGEVVVNLLDQNMLPRRGIFVDFFGVPACTTPAASIMARRTGAPAIVAVAIHEPDGRVRLRVDGPFPIPGGAGPAGEVRAHTQLLCAAIEAQVRAHPEQWLWLHRRWKTRPPPGARGEASGRPQARRAEPA